MAAAVLFQQYAAGTKSSQNQPKSAMTNAARRSMTRKMHTTAAKLRAARETLGARRKKKARAVLLTGRET
eukprot:3717595-Pleurochrysis_carterae.AAC.2